MTSLRLFVLGPPRLERDGHPIELHLRRALALLVYLAVTRQPQSRETLAALLWPESDEREARARLRRTLHRLSQDIGDDVVLGDGDALCLSPDAHLWVDSLAFQRHAAGLASEEGTDCLEAERVAYLGQAAELYTDDFLAGFALPDNPTWDEWQFYQRESLRQSLARVLEHLVEAQQAREAWEPAIGAARRWVGLDPLHEPAQRALMRLYALAGQQAAAVRQCREFARLLEAELGVPPDAETTALYEAIRTRRLGSRARTASPATATVTPQQAPSGPAVPGARSPARVPAGGGRPVGREAELRQLHRCLDTAVSGSRQVVFVTGEPGLGKTALVEAFVAEARETARLWVGQGQCLEHRGSGEPYMPILDALGRMCRAPGGEELIRLLGRHAPTWLVQMPGLISPAALVALQQQALGATRDRMLREMVEAIEALTVERPLVLVLEDLHWADYSSLDLLAWLARRQEPARLLVIGTYRPADAMMQDHPLHPVAQELRLRGYGVDLALTFLTEAAVREYLAIRCPGTALADRLAPLIHERTDGNPLFMVNLVDSWVAAGLLVEKDGQWALRTGPEALAVDVPDSLRELIARQFVQLSPEDQEILEVASVAGTTFSPAVIAAGVGDAEEPIETRCAALARRGQFLRASGIAEWPDGTVATGFAFIHQLYQHVLYERVPAGRQARLHRQIGARLEAGYAGQAHPHAAELAAHFVRGRDPRQAVKYLQLAAQQALQRSAHREAIEHLAAALRTLDNWPATRERAEQELRVQATLAPALIVTKGWGASETEAAFVRAYQLCQQLDDPPLRFQVLFGLAGLREFRGEYQQSQVLLEERLRAPDGQQADDFLLESHDLLACSLFHQGLFTEALDQAEHGLALYTPDEEHTLLATFGEEPEVQNHGWAALSLWYLGYPDRALARAHTGLRRAQDHLYSLASAQSQTAWIYQCRQEYTLTRQWAEATIALATKQGFPYRVAVGRVLRGWALAAQGQSQEGLAELREGVAHCLATGAKIDHPYFLALLADACSRGARIEEGLQVLDEALALVRDSRRFFYEAELYRLRGVLLLQAGGGDTLHDAEACYREAREVARRQEARSLELRAALSLSHLWREQGKVAEARSLLVEALGWFQEGFTTGDFRAASALLDELGGQRDHRPG